ncbi:MAG TPA: DUF2182 domain-containing protein [Candidatus Binataceae bacterium]|jgi:predicted metal-binding membrane protein|nr:DUF2182 domain-containing protein [Candidatus Binataceae bacterium]
MIEASRQANDPIIALLRRDRWIVLGASAALTLFTAAECRRLDDTLMGAGAGWCGASVARWGPADLTMIALMWSVMMIAMMTPTASPMVLAFAGLERHRYGGTRAPWATTGAFLSGYLMVWIGFSLLAALAEWGLHAATMRSASGTLPRPALAAVLMLTAGAFQFSPLKAACLRHCRTPVGFLLAEWREGTRGALVMGGRHGLYCVACCWLLMLVLLGVGAMNAAWCAGLAALVLAERILPGGLWLARGAGVALILAGAAVAARTW